MATSEIATIAVVDPDLTNCMLVREIALASGWVVAGFAHSTADGLGLLERTAPLCLVTDYRFDGDETGLHLIARAKRLLPDLFTVILTGWDINDVAAHVGRHAPDRILRKPIAPHVLMEFLNGVHMRVDQIRIDAV